MKTRYAVALALLAGAAIGSIGVGGLNAQGKAPGAYVVLTYTELAADQAGYKEQVADKAQAIIEKYGGRFLVRASPSDITFLRPGDTPFPVKRWVLIGFDSVQQAKDWYNSPEAKPVMAYIDQHTKGRIFAVKAE